MLICAPFSSRSGYGDHARSIFYALYDSKKYDIKLLDVRWGNTPRNFLNGKIKKHREILDNILKPNEPLVRQPEIYIDIRIPNEFETHGKYNIGITAGIETTAVSAKWLSGCNNMDLIIVPSEHSKFGFVNSVYDKVQSFPDKEDKKVGEFKLERPIEVVFEGVDTEIYKNIRVKDLNSDILKLINDTVSEKFAFLFVGQWIKGGYGEDRKDIFKTIKIFYESFANSKKMPSLILKTSGATFSLIDRKECLAKIKSIKDEFPRDWKLPNVYLLHGNLTDEEMNSLYNHPKIKCLVSFTHGEGFGRPLLEATAVGLPVICSNWSGPVDFLSDSGSLLINGELEQVPDSAVWEDIVIPESKWFVVDEHDAFSKLKYAYENKYEIKESAKSLMRKNLKTFTMEKMQNLIVNIIDEKTKDLASEVSIKLPKLKKT